MMTLLCMHVQKAAKVVELCNANYIGARAGAVQVCHSSSTAYTAQALGPSCGGSTACVAHHGSSGSLYGEMHEH